MSVEIGDFVPVKKTLHADARGRVALGPDAVERSFSVSRNDLGQFP